MSESIHGHRVMEMMAASKNPFTKASLEQAIISRFGEDARFHACSADDMTAHELIEFLDKRGKFCQSKEGVSVDPRSICEHE